MSVEKVGAWFGVVEQNLSSLTFLHTKITS